MPISFPDIAPAIDPPLQAALQRRIDGKTKPLGALGRIEQVAIQLGLIQRIERPVLRDPQLIVFAADHGLAAHGVSAYPSDVTWQMVENFLSGGAAVSVLARQHGIALTVVDAGVGHDFHPRPGLVLEHKQAHGTADALRQAAMDPAQCERAVRAGMTTVRALPGNAVLLGEMGIGNTSSAALLLSRLAGLDIDACTGRGTGLDDDALARKRGVLREVLARHVHATEPWDVLAAFGGFEIAMLAGAALQAAIERRVVVVDGFIAGAAVLWASRLAPQVLGYCIWAHRSAETGHRLLVEVLGARPLLDLELRLGEGSGAALAWPLVESAARILDEMASFESAGVSGKVEA